MTRASLLHRIMCTLGLHAWKKDRRIKGTLVRLRLCSRCPVRQEQDFAGGPWRNVPPVTRTRKAKSVAQNISEIRQGIHEDGSA